MSTMCNIHVNCCMFANPAQCSEVPLLRGAIQGRSQEFAMGASRGFNSEVHGQRPCGVWGQSPQKLETNVHVDFENMHTCVYQMSKFCTVSVNYF